MARALFAPLALQLRAMAAAQAEDRGLGSVPRALRAAAAAALELRSMAGRCTPSQKVDVRSRWFRVARSSRACARARRDTRAQHKQASRVRRLTHAMMAVAASRNEPGTFSTPQCSGAQSSDAPQLAVVGILSHDGRAAFRRAIRETWLRRVAHPPSIDARFVLRGIGAASSTIAEARVQRDIIFVPAQANATWAPPLQSVLLWYRCALAAWPAAQFIGKVRTRHHATCEP